MNPLVTNLDDVYVMSQADVAEKLFLHVNTIGATEKKAIENFKLEFQKRNIDIKDLL